MRGKPAAWAYRDVAIKLWDLTGLSGMAYREIATKVDDMAYELEREKRRREEEILKTNPELKLDE
jgi:hypothetical protein